MTDELDLNSWIGRRETVADIVTLAPARALAATLDRDPAGIAEGDPLPLPWHWLYAQVPVRGSGLGPDGHPKRGGFLPPVAEPRRMWAGSRITASGQLVIGTPLTRASTIEAIKIRQGRTGRLVFVTVHHAWCPATDGRPVLEERQDIVYRNPPAPGETPPPRQPAPKDAQWSRTVHPDPVLLMRYSGLTFNSHRIHYDLPYAQDVEGYRGLVVHGPLIATLLLDAVADARGGARVREFAFRAAAPLFADEPFTVNGRADADGKLALWAADADGMLAMESSASLA